MYGHAHRKVVVNLNLQLGSHQLPEAKVTWHAGLLYIFAAIQMQWKLLPHEWVGFVVVASTFGKSIN